MTAPTTTRPGPRPTGGPPPGERPVPARAATGAGGWLPEAALVTLTLASAVDLARLFQHKASFLGPVVLTALAVHGVCWACRRKGLGLGAAAAGSLVAAALVLAWTVLPHQTSFGVPSSATLHAAHQALTLAMNRFRTATPPAPSAPGFVLAGGVGCATVAFLSDWAAFRMRATIEACLPSLSVFVFSAALAQGHGVILATGVWLAALLGFLLVREAGLERPGPAWFASRAGHGPAAILQAGFGLGALALVAALVIGPHLPGATTRSLVNWHTHPGNGGGRTTGSPLVDIRSRLTDLSDVEAFTVTTNAPAYWRLTSLDTFDGSGWSLNDTYRHQGAALGTPVTQGFAVDGRFNITTLNSIWLPAAYRPVRYSGPGKVSYSNDAGSLIVDKSTSDGFAYAVTSSVPTPSVAALRASPPVDPNDPNLSRYLTLPRVPPLVGVTARQVTAGATTPYDVARKLQDYFRSSQFTYDLNVPPDDSENAIANFLIEKRGFCQQFAATYAVMARQLGLPARVAVGFTPGNLGSDGKLHVTDADAHAWPEVYFSGIGWVAFEPTPGRGAPGAQGYTGVAPQQASTNGAGSAITSTTLPSNTAAGATTPTTVRGRTQRTANTSGTTSHHRSDWALLGEVLLWSLPLLVLLLIPLTRALGRARRRAAASTPAARVLLAWTEAGEDLALAGVTPSRSDTPTEYARRAARRAGLSPDVSHALSGLADRVVEVSYAAGTPSVEVAEQAESCRSTVAIEVASRRSLGRRLLGAFDPRTLTRARGPDHR